MSWVTWGATIENYVPEIVFAASIGKDYLVNSWLLQISFMPLFDAIFLKL